MAEPPRPGEVKGVGFFGDTAAEATESARRYLGRCTEQNCRVRSEDTGDTPSGGGARDGDAQPDEEARTL